VTLHDTLNDDERLAGLDLQQLEQLVGLVDYDASSQVLWAAASDEGIRNEVRRIGLHSAGAPVAGFYTYGEIARTRGVGGFHNQTLVVLAFG